MRDGMLGIALLSIRAKQYPPGAFYLPLAGRHLCSYGHVGCAEESRCWQNGWHNSIQHHIKRPQSETMLLVMRCKSPRVTRRR
jgi:hypothetical protein